MPDADRFTVTVAPVCTASGTTFPPLRPASSLSQPLSPDLLLALRLEVDFLEVLRSCFTVFFGFFFTGLRFGLVVFSLLIALFGLALARSEASDSPSLDDSSDSSTTCGAHVALRVEWGCGDAWR